MRKTSSKLRQNLFSVKIWGPLSVIIDIMRGKKVCSIAIWPAVFPRKTDSLRFQSGTAKDSRQARFFARTAASEFPLPKMPREHQTHSAPPQRGRMWLFAGQAREAEARGAPAAGKEFRRNPRR
jgi:hypothetical protein